ncbi:HEAT repeat domain-containing protein, partial [Chloroflexota bacterium]
ISSIYAMGKNCDPSWVPIVLKELNNPDAEVRYEAAGACGELEEEEAVTGLKKLIDDFDVDVQMAAIQALGEIGNTEAKECLNQCLENENEVVSQMAEQVLKEMQSKEDPLSFRM